MSTFGLPGPIQGHQAEILPPEIEREIANSTAEFENRFGALAIMAKANGWIEDYRRELRRIAAAAWRAGRGPNK